MQSQQDGERAQDQIEELNAGWSVPIKSLSLPINSRQMHQFFLGMLLACTASMAGFSEERSVPEDHTAAPSL